MIAKLLFIGLLSATFAEHWYVENPDTQETCLIVDADPLISVKFGNATYDVPVNGTVHSSGNCSYVKDGQVLQQLSISFLPAGASATSGQAWILDLFFGSNNTIGAFQLVDYVLQTNPSDSMPGSATKRFVKAVDATNDVNANDKNGFKCSSTVLRLVDDSTVNMKEFKAIAFGKINGTDFPEGQYFEQCLADSKTSDIVPIIVGACLAGLVVVVLVAYLIGRARAKRQGYASV